MRHRCHAFQQIKYLFIVALLCSTTIAGAQTDSTETTDNEEDLMEILDQQGRASGGRDYVTATFKSTRVISGQSIENVGAGVLDFRILHRFAPVNTGIKDFFGLDNASMRMSFDYGVTNWLQVGVGRSTFMKEYDGLIKAKILRQTTDNRMPLSLSYSGSIMIYTGDPSYTPPAGEDFHTSSRMSYSNQLHIARKFNDYLSLQLSPTHIHYNLVPTADEKNDVLALGVGGRIKLSRRISFNAEWYYVPEDFKLNGTRNALSLGFDIETGGHVFQLHFTNATGMTDRAFIGQTTDNWGDGDIRFGFNLSRVFTVKKPKGFEGSRNKIY